MEQERAPLLQADEHPPSASRAQYRPQMAASVEGYGSHGVTGNIQEESDEDSTQLTEVNPDPTCILQACVFIEDAIHYRSIHHRLDHSSLIFYRFYYSKAVQWSVYVVITILLLLGFLEVPSSLTDSADLRLGSKRPVPPCGLTEGIEIACLLFLLADAIIKAYLRGSRETLQSRWLVAYIIIIFISVVDWAVSVGFLCQESVRVRRMFRPFFLLQNSSLMKKTVKSLRRTLPQVVSVLMLLFMHLYFFTLFGMLLFPKQLKRKNDTMTEPSVLQDESEHHAYFQTLEEAFMNLLVLLTTANNPDVTMPAYNVNRFYSIYFILYLGIGLYCLLNMLTAVIYNQFRGCFTDSIQASLFRRHLALKAAFEVLKMRYMAAGFSSVFHSSGQNVMVEDLQSVIKKLKIKRAIQVSLLQELANHPTRTMSYSEFQQTLAIIDVNLSTSPRPPLREVDNSWLLHLQRIFAHKYFNFFACAVAASNVVVITLELALEYDHVQSSRDNYLGVFNLVFIIYYGFEQGLKAWALGWARFCWDRGNIFDAFVTVILIIIEITYLSLYGVPYTARNHHISGIELWDLVRITNMLILIRLLRMVVTQIKTMFIVASTLLDLIKNLRAFAGLMVVLYYSYAVLGMELFGGAITYEDVKNMTNKTDYTKICGTYEQLDYWSNNFDDLMSALIVLWDVMIVNNWHVFLHAYSRYVNRWSQIYFIVWWLISVVFSANLFTALILENFIMRWDKRNHSHQHCEDEVLMHRSADFDSLRTDYITVHQMFREGLQVPSEESLLVELRQHPYFTSCQR